MVIKEYPVIRNDPDILMVGKKVAAYQSNSPANHHIGKPVLVLVNPSPGHRYRNQVEAIIK